MPKAAQDDPAYRPSTIPTFFLNAMDAIYSLHAGCLPLLVSIPHLGIQLPEEIRSQMTAEASSVTDTDWHLDRLYEFALSMGASVLGANVSRYAIDLNRPPAGESLYPGMTTTGLCPRETFRGAPLYLPGQAPDEGEVDRRRVKYWKPYHDALRHELERLQGLHGEVLLWEAHSIAGVLPRLFEGQLPDFNFGTHSGASCSERLVDAVRGVLGTTQLSHVLNGRFKGGYITRNYGQPDRGIHAIQLEMRQALYMNEAPPFDYRPELAEAIQPLLARMLRAGVDCLQALRA